MSTFQTLRKYLKLSIDYREISLYVYVVMFFGKDVRGDSHETKFASVSLRLPISFVWIACLNKMLFGTG